MTSAPRGKRTSAVEVTNVSQHGFWLLVQDRELFVAFEHSPWFRDAPIAQILEVQRPGPDHLYWPALDVDLSIESIGNPEAFPLISRAPPTATKRRPARAVESRP